MTVACVVCGGTAAERVGAGVDFEYHTCSNEFEFVACDGCGHVYLRNRPAEAELSTIYPDSYGNYAEGRERALTFRVKNALDRRRVRQLGAGGAPARVLDVGCADGRMLDVCRAVFPEALLHGIEISEAAGGAAAGKGYAVRIGTIDDIEVAEASYDLVFLQQVIEHVQAPDRVLVKLAAGLAPGGRLVIDTPTTDCVDFSWFRRRYWGGYHIPRHFNLFSEGGLRRLCEAAGLRHVATRYTPQPIHWVWTLHHALADRGWPGWSHGWLNIENPLAIGLCTGVELVAGVFTRRMSNLQLVVERASSG